MYTDLRFAFRQVRKRPGFSFIAILVLALGVGASTAVFSVLYEALLKPLPYPEASRLVFLHNSFPKSQLSMAGVSALDYAEISRHTEIFSQTGIYYFNDLTLTGAGGARHVDPVNVSASLFRVLGVQAELGRTINDEDDRYGAPKVVVLSDAFWRSAFDSSPGVLGRTVQLDGEPYTIISVMPHAFQFPYPATQLWLPMALKPSQLSEMGRMDKWLNMVGRLAPGVTMEQAQASLTAIGHHLAERFSPFYPEASGWRFALQPLVEEQTKAVRTWLLLAFGAVLCVLLVACSNVSGLLLVRTVARSNELAIRTALGAAKYRIVRLILTETAVLVFAGCGAGILLAAWAVSLFDRYGPVAHGARIETRTVLFAIVSALAGTFVAGTLPAWLSARLPLEQMLKSGSTRTATRTSNWRSVLTAVQIAVAVTLIFTATLLSRSFLKLMQVQPGFSPERVWSGTVALPRKLYRTENASLHFFQQLQEQIAALPEVESVSASTAPPFNASGVMMLDVSFPGRHETSNQSKAQAVIALPGYFETMRIPLRRGRTFVPQDRSGRSRVAIVDEEFARVYFPGEDPIGKLVGIGGEQDKPNRIIGVVANVENIQLGGPHKPEIYSPDPEELSLFMYVVARTKNDVDITSAVRNEVTRLDPNVALFDVATMSERLAQSLKLRRFIALLLSGFAIAGLVLAALGLFGSLANLVELRRREIGIRIVLGAVRQDIIRIVAMPVAVVVAKGSLAGTVGAIFVGMALRHHLFGVATYDAITWTLVLGVLALAAFAAAWLPLRRALRIEPGEALRDE